MNDTTPDGRQLGGLALIGSGTWFLLEDLFGLRYEGGWAVLLATVAVVLLVDVALRYRRAGRLDAAAGDELAGGLFLLGVAAVPVLGLAWGDLWPLVLVGIGVSVLTRGRGAEPPPGARQG